MDADWIVKSPSIANTNTLGSWINPYPNDDVPMYALALRPYERKKTVANGPGIPNKPEINPVVAPIGIKPQSGNRKLLPNGKRL